MKKKLIVLAAVVICLAIPTVSSMAYYTGTGVARNEITAGAVDITLVEAQAPGSTAQPTSTGLMRILPNTTLEKCAYVTNHEQPAWVRMAYTVTICDAQGEPLPLDADTLAETVIVPVDTANWTLQDGWWYYNTALATGEDSAPLYRQVIFSGENIGNEFYGCTFHLEVFAQAVQQANNGTSALTALGWPES